MHTGQHILRGEGWDVSKTIPAKQLLKKSQTRGAKAKKNLATAFYMYSPGPILAQAIAPPLPS